MSSSVRGGSAEGMEYEGRGNEKVTGWGMKEVGGRTGLFDQPLGYVFVGYLDLLVAGAGVGELFPTVGVIQVLPDRRHLFGDVEASVFLGHHLGKNDLTLATYKSLAKKTPQNRFRIFNQSKALAFPSSCDGRGSWIWRVSNARKPAATHLDYMQLGQQVAVCQRHFIPVQEVAVWEFDVLDAVVVNLIGQRWAQVIVQLLQRLQESTLKRWKK